MRNQLGKRRIKSLLLAISVLLSVASDGNAETAADVSEKIGGGYFVSGYIYPAWLLLSSSII